MKKTLGILIATILVFTLSLSTFAASFTDVSSNHWAYDAINKLVASGIVEGFPDGTFRPDEPFNREQMAVVVSRILVKLNEEQSALEDSMSGDISSLNDDVNTLQDEVDKLSSGLTTQQAQDVESLVKVLMEKNMPEQDALSEAQAEEVTELIEKLTQEFQVDIMNLESEVAANAERNEIQFNHLEEQINERYEELTEQIQANAEQAEDNRIELKAQKNINAMKFSDVNDSVDAVEEDVADVDERVTDIEERPVKFSGSYAVDFTDQRFAEGEGIEDTDYYWINDPDDYDSEADKTDPTIFTEETEDPILYTDPWDTDSDEIAADDSGGEIAQTLNLQWDIATDVFTSTVTIDVHEEEEEFVLDSADLTLENDFIKMNYNEANTADIADYAFSEAEVNGVNVTWKNYGIDSFVGIKGYGDNNDEVSTEDHDVIVSEDVDGTDFDFTSEEAVTKYELDDGVYKPIRDEEDDYYVFGAKKTFGFAGFNFNTKYAGRHPLDRDDLELDNYLGMDTSTEMVGFDLDFDMGYYIPADDNEDSGSLMRFGVARDMNLAGVEFNYKNRGQNFDPISGNDVIFDSGDDDYDKFTTGLGDPDMSGWNFTVQPYVIENMLSGLDTEIFYSSLNNEDGDDLTKLKLTGEMGLFLDGLTVDGKYAIVTDSEATENENTMNVGAEYEYNDYISADVSYETVTNIDNETDDNKATTSYGFDVSEYPVIWDFTVSGGYSSENITDIDSSVNTHDKTTTEYNFGLGYTLGKADLGYSYTSKNVEGTVNGADPVDDAVEEGIYTTNTFDMTYAITSNTDITAEYEILNLEDTDGDLNGADDYEVHNATAGVKVSF